MNFLNLNTRFLDQQALDHDFERLVQESPVPQLLHREPSNVCHNNTSFISPCALTVRPTSVSAIPIVKSAFASVSPLAPFRSPQTLSRSFHGTSHSISDVFNSLKNDSLKTTDSSFRESQFSKTNSLNNNNNTSKLQLRTIPSHSPRNQDSNRLGLKGNNQHISSGKLTQSSDGYMEQFKQYVQRANKPAETVCNEHETSLHGTATHQHQVDVRMGDQQVDVRTRTSDGEETGYEETFQEAFGENNTEQEENSFDDDQSVDSNDVIKNQEPCSLYMWIIKPVSGTRDICVEGKKSLSDENFWHSGVITRRLDEKVVATKSGSVYRLEGNMELLDAMSAGFSHSMAEAFWLGFPPDWEILIQEHFQRIPQARAEPEGEKEVEDDISVMDDEEVQADGAPAPLDHGADEDSQSNNMEDNDPAGDTADEALLETAASNGEIAVTEVDPRSQMATVHAKTRKKDHVLSKWIIRPLPTNQGLYVLGINADGMLWHSSTIEKRLDRRRLLSSTGAVYRLKGAMDTLLALDEGIPTKLIDKFKNGFPKEWQEVVQQELSNTENQPKNKKKVGNGKPGPSTKSKRTDKLKSKSDPKLTDNGGTSNKKNVSKKESSKMKSLTALSVSKTCKSVDKMPSNQKQKQKDKKVIVGTPLLEKSATPVTSRPKSVKQTMEHIQPKKLVLTPRGEMVDIDTIGCSRSGRLIKPPLQWWTGQTLSMGENGIVIKAPTAYANKYLQEFEDGYTSSKRKLQPYWNPRHKDKDYTSFNSSRSSLNDSQSSITSTKSADLNKIIKLKGSLKLKDSKARNETKVETGLEDIISQKRVQNLDDSYPKLELEMNDILEKARSKSGSKRFTRATCYNTSNTSRSRQHGNNSTSNSSNRTTRNGGELETIGENSIKDNYSFDDIHDSDNTTLVNESDTSSDNKPKRGSSKTKLKKKGGGGGKGGSDKMKKLVAAKIVEQENVVSSSTGEMKNENKTKLEASVSMTRSRSTTANINRTMAVQKNEENVSIFTTKGIRSCRFNKKLPVICEDEDSEIDEKPCPVKRSQKRPGKKMEVTKVTTTGAATVIEEDHWTKEEKERLHKACKSIPPNHSQYWEKVSDMVRTKMSDDCKEMYYKEKQKPPSARKSKQKEANVKPKVTSLTANVGTLKRKQQLRDMLDQHNADYQDDIFDSTPYRQTRKRKMAKLGDTDDDAIFEELARKQGKNRYETPVATGPSQSRVGVPFASEKKTPASTLNVEILEDNRDMDGYVHNMLKRRLLARGRRKHVETPKPKKTIQNKPDDSPQKKLFHDYINEIKDTADNHADSDQEEDFYWDDETNT